MSNFKPQVSLDVLPNDALMLKDEEFYCLVEKLTSIDVSQMLKIQRINSINTFLLCKGIAESILLPTSAFEVLRRHTCVKLDQNNNNCYVVHVGILGQIDYLTELFRKKHLQENKVIAKRSSAPDARRIVLNDTSSNAICPSSNQTISTVTDDILSLDPRSKIITCIDKWIDLQEKSNGSKCLKLVEGIHYSVQFSSPDIAIFICQCKVRISIPKSPDGGFPLSNLYKHWKNCKRCDVFGADNSSSSSGDDSTSSSTDHSANNSELDEPNEENNVQDLDMSSTPIAQATVSSNNKRSSSSHISTFDRPLRKRRRQ